MNIIMHLHTCETRSTRIFSFFLAATRMPPFTQPLTNTTCSEKTQIAAGFAIFALVQNCCNASSVALWSSRWSPSSQLCYPRQHQCKRQGRSWLAPLSARLVTVTLLLGTRSARRRCARVSSSAFQFINYTKMDERCVSMKIRPR